MPDAPRIFVVMRHDLRKGRWQNIVQETYLEQIAAGGGVPIPIPRVQGTVDRLDAYGPVHGLLVVEGNDIDTRRYGGADSPPDLIEPPDLERDALEFALIARVLAEGQPYLGVCRGCHAFNIARGGTLYGDVRHELGAALKHVDPDNYDGYRHEIAVVEGTPLHAWVGATRFMANSFHHQGIKTLGEGLAPMCHTSDGLIEGFYDTGHPFRIGLQFHPERHVADDAQCMNVFEAFVTAAKAFFRQGRTD